MRFFAPFADPIIFLFIGSFMLAEAMFVHGLDRRIAFTALSSRLVGTSPTRILIVFGGVTTVLSMWISNTATTAMMFPIGLSIVAHLTHGREKAPGSREFAIALEADEIRPGPVTFVIRNVAVVAPLRRAAPAASRASFAA